MGFVKIYIAIEAQVWLGLMISNSSIDCAECPIRQMSSDAAAISVLDYGRVMFPVPSWRRCPFI